MHWTLNLPKDSHYEEVVVSLCLKLMPMTTVTQMIMETQQIWVIKWIMEMTMKMKIVVTATLICQLVVPWELDSGLLSTNNLNRIISTMMKVITNLVTMTKTITETIKITMLLSTCTKKEDSTTMIR